MPRWAFLSLGDFALREAERSYSYLDSGLGGLPEHDGIVQRFESYARHHREADGVHFLRAAISYIKDQLGLDQDSFLFEMVSAFSGMQLSDPTQDALAFRRNCQSVSYAGNVRANASYWRVFGIRHGRRNRGNDLYIPEPASKWPDPKRDKIAIATPIFSPYLEIPVLAEYGLEIVDIRMDEHADWQLPESEINKLLDPTIKLFCLVNPSNPPSSKLSDEVLDQIANLVETERPDLFIITDDVYGTFADDFVSLFAKCPA